MEHHPFQRLLMPKTSLKLHWINVTVKSHLLLISTQVVDPMVLAQTEQLTDQDALIPIIKFRLVILKLDFS